MVTVSVNGNHNVVFTDRVTLVRLSKKAKLPAKVELPDNVPMQADNTPDACSVERFGRREGGNEGTIYLVRQCIYSSTDNTGKLSHHVRQQLISHYWEHQQLEVQWRPLASALK